jgi:hypothetical protein
MRLRLLAVPLSLHLLAAGCSGSDGDLDSSACRAALAHVAELHTQPPDDADADTRAELAAHRANLTSAIDAVAIECCEDRSSEWGRCVLAAADIDQLRACDGGER